MSTNDHLTNAAMESNTPPYVLAMLVKTDVSGYIQYLLASNPSSPPKTLLHLANTDNFQVRRQVARHGNTPLPLLTELAQDREATVRCGVAANPHAPPELLEKLLSDEDWVVRAKVAIHPNLPVVIKVFVQTYGHIFTL